MADFEPVLSDAELRKMAGFLKRIFAARATSRDQIVAAYGGENAERSLAVDATLAHIAQTLLQIDATVEKRAENTDETVTKPRLAAPKT